MMEYRLPHEIGGHGPVAELHDDLAAAASPPPLRSGPPPPARGSRPPAPRPPARWPCAWSVSISVSRTISPDDGLRHLDDGREVEVVERRRTWRVEVTNALAAHAKGFRPIGALRSVARQGVPQA